MVKLLELLTRGLVYQSIRNTTTMVCYGMKSFFPDGDRMPKNLPLWMKDEYISFPTSFSSICWCCNLRDLPVPQHLHKMQPMWRELEIFPRFEGSLLLGFEQQLQ